MRIGIPKEVKPKEGRVALIPEAVAELVAQGHELLIEQGAGLLSGYPDNDFAKIGARIVENATALFQQAELIVKVKEPYGDEVNLLGPQHTLFSYLHLAPLPELTQKLVDCGVTAIGFETVVDDKGRTPLLAPMSDIAGRLAIHLGTHLLHCPMGGKGIMLGGVPATERGKVVILGAGAAGSNAALVAASLGAEVVVFERKRERQAQMRALGDNVTALYPYREAIEAQLAEADLLVGAILVVGEKTPHLVSEAMVKGMQKGSVIIDISVDQGGCIETTHPTDYDNPTFVLHDVVHFGVTNMPGAVPRTASQALSASLLPYVADLAASPQQLSPALAQGVNVRDGEIVHPALK